MEVTIDYNSNTLNAIKLGNTVLKENQDYTLNGAKLMISSTFLSTLSTGEYSIILDFDKGKDLIFKITIKDTTPIASITPSTALFDKSTDKQEDIEIYLTLNGHQFLNILDKNTTLVLGTDYTISNNTITLLSSYLCTLAIGDTSLTFQFSGGNDSVLTVNVINTDIPVSTGDLVIQSFNGNISTSTNGVSPKFKLINNGESDINLSEVTLRYYYTIDGDLSQSFWCDWASIGSSYVKYQFVKLDKPVTGADYYLELTFSTTAGTLKPGQSAEIQARFSKSNWSNYTQTNDYSFNATSNQYVNTEKVTGYINTTLVWGVEP